MDTKKMLEKMSRALQGVLADLDPPGVVKTRKMALTEFVRHTLDELKKAGSDEPSVALQRLRVLEKNIESVLGQVEKLVAEDTESASIRVDVETAWAPAKADGDRVIDGLTATGEQSSTEVSMAAKLASVTKALGRLKDDLEPAPSSGEPEERPSQRPETSHWPLDMNSDDFRRGVAKSEKAPVWGHDPEGVRAARD